MYEKEDAEAPKCPACGAPMIREMKNIACAEPVTVWACSEQKTTGCP